MSGFTSDDYAAAIAKRIAWALSGADDVAVEKDDEYTEGYVSEAFADRATVRIPFEVDTIDVGEYVVTVRAATKDDR